MLLSAKSGTDKAVVYGVVADFADEESKNEMFAVEFGTVENANLFNEKFDEARQILKTKCSLYNGEADWQQLDEEESEKWGNEEKSSSLMTKKESWQ
ncbi:hypothetical protein WA026_014972 [Henosepilachna vigintioctopunctata]|uniref:RanBD1 domain-containing protein n=1 Tax=Henosepilachna vigintioctopunctata TaxID=420089 RepID=A0AAW1UBU3_9CUCU